MIGCRGRYLAEAGAVVAFYLVKPRDVADDENLARVEEMGLEVLLADYDQRFRVLRHRLRVTDIIIDALLGTGVTRPIEGQLATIMEQVGAAIAEKRRAAGRARRRPGLGQVAPGHQPVAAVVARPDQHQHRPLGHVVALLHSIGHAPAGGLHHLGVGKAGRVGRLLDGHHLSYGVDFDRHRVQEVVSGQWSVGQ